VYLDESPFLPIPLIWCNPKGLQGGEVKVMLQSTQEELDEAITRVKNLAFRDDEGNFTGKFDTAAVAIFDLDRPLKPQIERLQKQLADVPMLHPNREPRIFGYEQNWSRHLRVIDAEDKGASPTEIFEVIMGDELTPEEYDSRIDKVDNASQAGKNMIKAAREIMRKVSVNL
jgi:hypothetical protein